ncbi:MAG: hypothetical protein AAGI24_13100 [Pseudomonadota bacterium]
MVKKLPTKAELRAELEQETRRYLDKGGAVQEIPRGTSGSDAGNPINFRSSSLFNDPPSTRTLVPEVVAAIESRRNQLKRNKRAVPKRSQLRRPRRKTVYDDFGEPIRKVWVED